jgi:hypothetical protein
MRRDPGVPPLPAAPGGAFPRAGGIGHRTRVRPAASGSVAHRRRLYQINGLEPLGASLARISHHHLLRPPIRSGWRAVFALRNRAPRKVGMPLTLLAPTVSAHARGPTPTHSGSRAYALSRKVKEIRHKKTVKLYLAPGFHAGTRDALPFHERYDGSPHEEYKPFSSLCDPPGE